jgi:hypothetical protein
MTIETKTYSEPGVLRIIQSGVTTIQPATKVNVTWLRNSVRTPGFRKESRGLRSLPMNPFTYTLDKQIRPSGWMHSWNPTVPASIINPSIYLGDLYSFVVNGNLTTSGVSDAEKAAIDRELRTRMLLKLKDQKTNLAQAWAEREQLSRMMIDTITRFASCINNLKKMRFSSAARNLGIKVSNRRVRRYNRDYKKDQSRAVANGWLQLQYGWKPLLSDIHGAAELLAQKLYERIPEVERIVVQKSIERNASDKFTDNSFTVTATHKIRYSQKIVIYFEQTSPVFRTASQIGLTNPLYLAWELVPFSFVVDWFLPIGNWLSSLDATLGFTFKKGCSTTFERVLTSGVWEMNKFAVNGTTMRSGMAVGSRDRINCQRSGLASFPFPARPNFKDPFSTLHLANALALLSQTFKK